MAALTIDLPPDEHRLLAEEAARRQLPLPEVARTLLHAVLVHDLLPLLLDSPRTAEPGGAAALAWEDARLRLQEAVARDSALAARSSQPLNEAEPQHELLDRLRAGEFRR